jgi:hypothetical protein
MVFSDGFQTYQIRIVIRCLEHRYLVYYQITVYSEKTRQKIPYGVRENDSIAPVQASLQAIPVSFLADLLLRGTLPTTFAPYLGTSHGR